MHRIVWARSRLVAARNSRLRRRTLHLTILAALGDHLLELAATCRGAASGRIFRVVLLFMRRGACNTCAPLTAELVGLGNAWLGLAALGGQFGDDTRLSHRPPTRSSRREFEAPARARCPLPYLPHLATACQHLPRVAATCRGAASGRIFRVVLAVPHPRADSTQDVTAALRRQKRPV